MSYDDDFGSAAFRGDPVHPAATNLGADHPLSVITPTPAAAAAPMVTQIGPLDTGPIAFDDGVPVGGGSTLTLYRDGAFSFSGHFHDSGAPSYDLQMAWVVVDSAGHAITFARTGHVEGTSENPFDPERDVNWDQSGVNPVVAASFASLAEGFTYHWRASADWDVASLVGSIIEAARAAGVAITTVSTVVG